MRNFIHRLLHDSRGATAVEYGLICALIVLAMMTALIAVGETTTSLWDKVADKVVNPH